MFLFIKFAAKVLLFFELYKYFFTFSLQTSKNEEKMYYIVVILSVFAAACAQMLLKKGTQLPSSLGDGRVWRFLKQYLNPWVIGGYTIMFASMVVNIWAMSKGVMVKEVSIIESLSYLFVPVLSFFLFREKLTWKKIGAIGVIMCGIIIFFI